MKTRWGMYGPLYDYNLDSLKDPLPSPRSVGKRAADVSLSLRQAFKKSLSCTRNEARRLPISYLN